MTTADACCILEVQANCSTPQVNITTGHTINTKIQYHALLYNTVNKQFNEQMEQNKIIVPFKSYFVFLAYIVQYFSISIDNIFSVKYYSQVVEEDLNKKIVYFIIFKNLC